MRIINKKDNKALIYYNNEFYLVSESDVPLSGLETLVFRCDPTGHVSSYMDVGGGRGITLDEVLNNVGKYMYDRWEEE